MMGTAARAMSDLPDDRHQHRDWLLAFVDLPESGLAVDLGCGSGRDLLALAARHPDPAARFVGLDVDADAIAAARVAAAAGDARLAFDHVGLGGMLPFGDASVDVVFSHNLVECLPDREVFAREVARVLRPGGLAVVAHWDFDSQLFDGTDKPLVRRLVHAYADLQQAWMAHADGWMGRRLWGTFAPTSLFDGAVHARVLTNTAFAAPWYGHASAGSFRTLVRRGLATAAEYERFVADLEALDREGRYFYSITGYAYVGRRRG